MKNLENYGVQELGIKEMVFIEGGRRPWKKIFSTALEIAGVLFNQYSDVQDPDNPLIG